MSSRETNLRPPARLRMVRENYGCAKAKIIAEDSKTINKRTRPSLVVVETCIPHIEKKIKQEKKGDSDQ